MKDLSEINSREFVLLFMWLTPSKYPDFYYFRLFMYLFACMNRLDEKFDYRCGEFGPTSKLIDEAVDHMFEHGFFATRSPVVCVPVNDCLLSQLSKVELTSFGFDKASAVGKRFAPVWCDICYNSSRLLMCDLPGCSALLIACIALQRHLMNCSRKSYIVAECFSEATVGLLIVTYQLPKDYFVFCFFIDYVRNKTEIHG